jgi:hypothetical protein
MFELCKHGSIASYFSLAFSALVIFFEQLSKIEVVFEMVTFLFSEINFLPLIMITEISSVRKRLLINAMKMTPEEQTIARFATMMSYSFEDIVELYLQQHPEVVIC